MMIYLGREVLLFLNSTCTRDRKVGGGGEGGKGEGGRVRVKGGPAGQRWD